MKIIKCLLQLPIFESVVLENKTNYQQLHGVMPDKMKGGGGGERLNIKFEKKRR